VRSFVRREGRITTAQERALTELWHRYGCPDTNQPLDLGMLFGRAAPRHLEIGCGNGDFILDAAVAHPENDYLGIEVHRPGLGHLLHRASECGVRNLRVLNLDAAEALARLLPAQAFECTYVFFPDPWPKKRHHKRRLLNPERARLLRALLAPHGRLFVATDWDDYAQAILEALATVPGLVNLAGAAVWSPRPRWRPVTRYERRARRLNHAIRDLAYGCV